MENKELFILDLSSHLTSLDVFASVIYTLRYVRGEAGLKKIFFSPLGSVWSKTKEGPSPRSATVEFTCLRGLKGEARFSGRFRRGALGTRPPLFLDQTEAQRAEKNCFGELPPHLSKGLDDRPPSPLISRSGSTTEIG